MSFSVNVRLGEVSATTSLSELSASVTISGGLLRSIPFSANKDTELEFADTITFSVDNPKPGVEYLWRVENSQGTKEAKGTQVKQDYTSEGQYDVKVLGHYLNQGRLEGINYQKDFVKVDFKFPGNQLLDEGPGAAAAYSVRLLRQQYSDGLLRVRAVDSSGTDQGEADVLPKLVTSDGSVTISLNSPIEKLDNTAQGRGLSNSDTLGDLVDSGGANYDGFVPKWYDQSPNARHATNSTASEQPQIVSAGALIQVNNKPALETFGIENSFNLGATGFTKSLDKVSTFSVIKGKIFDHADRLWTIDDKITFVEAGKNSPAEFYYFGDMPGVQTSNGSYNQNQNLHTLLLDNTIAEANYYINGSLRDTDTSSPISSSISNGELVLFNRLSKDQGADQFQQENIFYFEDKSSDRSVIEKNQNEFFNIPNF